MNLFKTGCAIGTLIFFHSHASNIVYKKSVFIEYTHSPLNHDPIYKVTEAFQYSELHDPESFFLRKESSVVKPTKYGCSMCNIACLMHIKGIPQWGASCVWIINGSNTASSFLNLFLRQHPLTLRDHALCFISDSFDRQDPLLESLPENLRTIIQEIAD